MKLIKFLESNHRKIYNFKSKISINFNQMNYPHRFIHNPLQEKLHLATNDNIYNNQVVIDYHPVVQVPSLSQKKNLFFPRVFEPIKFTRDGTQIVTTYIRQGSKRLPTL